MRKSIIRLFFVGAWLGVTAGCASFSEGIGQSEASLASEVQGRLNDDGVTARQGIGVTEEYGVVTLSGSVRDPGVRARAVSIARGTPEVRGVVENFTR